MLFPFFFLFHILKVIFFLPESPFGFIWPDTHHPITLNFLSISAAILLYRQKLIYFLRAMSVMAKVTLDQIFSGSQTHSSSGPDDV